MTGLDYNRACLMLAVLEKQGGMRLSAADIFLNVPGGLRLAEPAADLGVVLALASSARDLPVRADTACLGEVGLTGEIRAVPRLELRLSELARRGFRRVLIPARQEAALGRRSREMEVVAAEHILEAVEAGLASAAPPTGG